MRKSEQKNIIHLKTFLLLTLFGLIIFFKPSDTQAATENNICDTLYPASANEWIIPAEMMPVADALSSKMPNYPQSLITLDAYSKFHLVNNKSKADIQSIIKQNTALGFSDQGIWDDIKSAYNVAASLADSCPQASQTYASKELTTSIIRNIDDAVSSSNQQSAGSIKIESKDKVSLTEGKTPINITLAGFPSDSKYILYINNLKDQCPAGTEETRCWDIKQEGAAGNENNSNIPLNYTWNLSEAGTKAGDHTIRVKVFDKNGLFIQKEEKGINVCNTTENCTSNTPEPEPTANSYVDSKDIIASSGLKPELQTFDGIVKKVFGTWFPQILGIVAFIGLIVAGILLLTSAGNPTNAEKGKKALIYSVIGIALAVASYVIIQIVNNEIFNSFK